MNLWHACGIFVVWLISRLVSIIKGVWLPTIRGEGAIMSGLRPTGGNVISQSRSHALQVSGWHKGLYYSRSSSSHHREGTTSSAWLLPQEHLGHPPWWSCWRRSMDETGWNCGPVRSGKIWATQRSLVGTGREVCCTHGTRGSSFPYLTMRTLVT